MVLQDEKLLRKVAFRDLGLTHYEDAWNYQEELFQSVIATKVANRYKSSEEQNVPQNFLLFTEHHPVYTLGKSGDEKNLLLSANELAENKIAFFANNRGGDITYHGPGQIVGYPILDLDQFFTDIHKYLRFLEEAVIQTLAHYNIEATRIPGLTGVWIDATLPTARKICAYGVRCSRWVTMHGLALNVNTDLNYFNHIVPCGIQDKGVTSIAKEIGRQIDMEETKALLRENIANVFEMNLF